MAFDAVDIQGSVPKLMAGLRTAFWSSIAGLLGALSLKLRAVISQTQQPVQDQTRHASIDDLDSSLKQLVAAVPAQEALMKEQQQALVKALAQIAQSLDTSRAPSRGQCQGFGARH